jgi:hypothetical protein
MTIIKILNLSTNYIDNDLVLFSIITGCVVGALGYKIVSSILKSKSVDKGTQTDASENMTDRPNQITQENLTSIETLSPVSSTSSINTLSPVSSTSSIETLSPVSSTFTMNPTTSEVGVQTITKNINTVTTDLPISPINKEVVPNLDIVGKVIDPSNADYIATKVEQLNALDPFSATPWTPEKVQAMIDNLEIFSNLF